MFGCEPAAIPFSTDALRSSLLRSSSQPQPECGLWISLTAVFELVEWWAKEGKAVKRDHRALHLRGYSSVSEPEPFASIIRCTSDPNKVDDRTRSKWSRVLRYAAEFKDLDEPLRDFIKRKGRYQ